MATGINLATNLSIPAEGPTRMGNKLSVEMFSSNLISTGANWVLNFSTSGDHFGYARDSSDEIISGTLAVNTTTVLTVEAQNGMYWLINFTSGVGSTGSVAYVIL